MQSQNIHATACASTRGSISEAETLVDDAVVMKQAAQ